MPIVEKQNKTYSLSGKTLREKLGIDGIISHVDVTWQEDKDKKSYPVITINTRLDIDLA